MVDPVFTADGYTYEREAIEEWLKTHDISPKTGLALAHKQLTPNWDKKSEITDFLEQHPETYEITEIYLPKSTIERLLAAINDNKIEVVRNLLTQDRRLLTYDLKEQATKIIESLQEANIISSKLESGLPQDNDVPTTHEKITVFYFAGRFGSPELVEMILEQLQHTEQLDKQLAIPKPSNWTLIYLNALLQKSLEQGNNDQFCLLLQLGADLEQPDTNGNTLLHRMVINKKKEAVALLIKNKALLESRNLEGNTSLFLAVLQNDSLLTKVLLENGGNPAVACGAEQLTPLHAAAKQGNTEIIINLLQHKAEIDAVDSNGNTPLHLSAENMQERTIILLLESGAYHKARNYQGYTAVEVARHQNKPKIAVFIEHKARKIKQSNKEEINLLRQRIAILESRVSELSVITTTNVIHEELFPRESYRQEENVEFYQILRMFKQTYPIEIIRDPITTLETNFQDAQKFLNHVSSCAYDAAEAMLLVDKNLALVSGRFRDDFRRQFIQMTGFQYALVIINDNRMWSMIKKYLSKENLLEQIEELNNKEISQEMIDINNYESGELPWHEQIRIEAESFYEIAEMHKNGIGIPPDSAKAIEWYKKSINRGNKKAIYVIAKMYKDGDGVPQDGAKAIEWYQKILGFIDMGQCVYDDPDVYISIAEIYKNGIGIPQDGVKAIEWYQKIDAKVSTSCDSKYLLIIANMYRYGDGIPQDGAKAIEWYQKAVDRNNSGDAIFNIAEMYENGVGIYPDYCKAIEWYQKATTHYGCGEQAISNIKKINKLRANL